MCSQLVSGSIPINPVGIPIKEVPSSSVGRTSVKGGVPMPSGKSLQARLNAKPLLLSVSKDGKNSFKDVQAKRRQTLKETQQQPEGTPPPKTEGMPRQEPMRIKDGGVPQSGLGVTPSKTVPEARTTEGTRLAAFKAGYWDNMRRIDQDTASTKPDPSKQANILLANAANAKGQLVDFLFERREQLGGEFAGLSKEQLADRQGEAPLARLSATDRMVVAELRALRQTCLDRLNAMADAPGNAAFKVAALERIGILDDNLKIAKSTVSDAIKSLFRQDKERGAKLEGILNQCMKGELPDPIKLNPLIGEMMKDVEKEGEKKFYLGVLETVFTGIANLAGERALLQRGEGAPESTLRDFDASRSAAWWSHQEPGQQKNNLGMFNDGMLVLHFCKATQTVRVPKEYKSREDYKDFSKEFTGLGKGGNNLPPPAAVDEKLQALLKDLMPGKVSKSARETALRAAVWKFDQALRFNAGDRLLVGLSSHFSEQIKTYVKSAPLSGKQKSALHKGLLEVADKYVLRVPSGGKNLTSGAQGAPRLVSLKPGETPVLVKNFHEGRGNPPSAVSMLREMIMQEIGRDNPHIPKVIGIGKPQPTADGKEEVPPKLSLIMEAVPGKSLNSYLHTGFHDVDEKTDKLITGLSPEARGKVAVHLVAGGIRGLAPLHAKGLAHMDVKPGNIMLDENSLEGRLIDFGSACVPGTVTEKTPGYVPPDCFVASLASDVYALGVSLMQLAMGTITNKFADDWQDNLGDTYWEEHKEAKPLREAAEILMDPVGADRPTMDQLLAILDGRPVPVKDEEKGGATLENIDILKKVFDPKSDWAGGRDVLAEGMRPTKS